MNPKDLENAFLRCLARIAMKEKGHVLTSAAESIGIDFGHLRRVLIGERESNTTLRAVISLPPRLPASKHLIHL